MLKTKWEKLVEKYLFLYKDGFFELPYLSNSPAIMYNSVIENPVTQNKQLEQGIYSNNPFCRGTMFYRKIDENFWVLPTQIEVKQNIIAKAIYDDNFPSDFFVLSFSKFIYEFPIKSDSSANVKLQSICWTFYKPRTEVETYFYKNTKGKFYNFIFDRKWIIDNIVGVYFPKTPHLSMFFDSEIGFYTWLNVAPEANQIANKILKIIQAEKAGIFNVETIKSLSIQLIKKFFENTINDSRLIENVSLSNYDYAKIAKAEKMILLHLSEPFIGIETIASAVNMSPSKLKSNFKSVFGFSLLQYHKEKNMLLAMQLIKKSDIMIQDVASMTGYDSASKFATSFKKKFGNLPTTFR